jgi:phage shock protein C
MADQPNRLYRSRTNRVIAGVCGGIAEYFDIDPTLVRLVWILLTILGGWGILLYIAALIIVPLNPSTTSATMPPTVSDSRALPVFGIVLIAVGLFFLFLRFDVFSFREMMHVLWSYLFPVVLIGVGVYLLMQPHEREKPQPPPPEEEHRSSEPQEPRKGRRGRRTTKQPAAEPPSAEPPRRRLMRSITDRKLFGVCGGLGEYFDVDPTIIRILFVVFTLISFGFGLLLYLALIVVMPKQPRVAAT